MKGKKLQAGWSCLGAKPDVPPPKGLRSVHPEGSAAARAARASQTAGGIPGRGSAASPWSGVFFCQNVFLLCYHRDGHLLKTNIRWVTALYQALRVLGPVCVCLQLYWRRVAPLTAWAN